MLLEAGAVTSRRTPPAATALFAAVFSGKPRCVAALLGGGADPKLECWGVPLHEARARRQRVRAPAGQGDGQRVAVERGCSR